MLPWGRWPLRLRPLAPASSLQCLVSRRLFLVTNPGPGCPFPSLRVAAEVAVGHRQGGHRQGGLSSSVRTGGPCDTSGEHASTGTRRSTRELWGLEKVARLPCRTPQLRGAIGCDAALGVGAAGSLVGASRSSGREAARIWVSVRVSCGSQEREERGFGKGRKDWRVGVAGGEPTAQPAGGAQGRFWHVEFETPPGQPAGGAQRAVGGPGEPRPRPGCLWDSDAHEMSGQEASTGRGLKSRLRHSGRGPGGEEPQSPSGRWPHAGRAPGGQRVPASTGWAGAWGPREEVQPGGRAAPWWRRCEWI